MKNLNFSIILLSTLFTLCSCNNSHLKSDFKNFGESELNEEPVDENNEEEENEIESPTAQTQIEDTLDQVENQDIVSESSNELVGDNANTPNTEENIVTDAVASEVSISDDSVIFYEFDQVTGKCLNNEEIGFNVNYKGNCGSFVGGSIEGLDATKNDYYGIRLEDTHIYNSKLTLDDLVRFQVVLDDGTSIEGMDNNFRTTS